MSRRKRFSIGIITLLLAALFTSCGTAKKDDIASDLNNISNATKSDAEQSDIPNRLEYVLQDVFGDASITVSADVEANGLENACVYEVTRKEFNEETLKQIADNFFDGDYTYIKPYGHCSLEELELEEAFYQQLMDEHDNKVYLQAGVYRNKIAELLDGYNENAASYVEHNGLIYHNNQWREEDSFWGQAEGHGMFQVTEADYSRLRGERDGNIYELYYGKYYIQPQSGIESYYTGYDTYSGGQHDEEMLVIKRVDTPYDVNWCKDMDEADQSNACDYDTALKQAEHVAEQLGFYDLELAGTRQLDISSILLRSDGDVDRTSLGLNGYEFWFWPATDGKNVFDCRGKHMIAFGSDHDDDWLYETGQPLFRVLVADNGVLEIDIGDMYSINEGTKAELMPFEQVDKRAQDYMSSDILFCDIEVSSIKLGYLYISYDGIRYSLIPVWEYDIIDSLHKGEAIYINALDGERIRPGTEKQVDGYHVAILDFYRETQGLYNMD